MAAVILQIADAVKAELNGHTFSQAFTSERYFRPVFDLPDMAQLHVSVVPTEIITSSLGRSVVQQDYAVEVAVQKVVEEADLDGLMSLVEEIADFFRNRRLAQYPGAVWVRTDNAPLFRPEQWDSMKLFTSVLKITFRGVR